MSSSFDCWAFLLSWAPEHTQEEMERCFKCLMKDQIMSYIIKIWYKWEAQNTIFWWIAAHWKRWGLQSQSRCFYFNIFIEQQLFVSLLNGKEHLLIRKVPGTSSSSSFHCRDPTDSRRTWIQGGRIWNSGSESCSLSVSCSRRRSLLKSQAEKHTEINTKNMIK